MPADRALDPCLQRPLHRRHLMALAAAVAAPAGALAATYPTRPVRVFVGAVAGGPADFLARLFCDTAITPLGQAGVVENKPGASSTFAADAAAKVAPDGHGLLVTGPAAIAMAPHLFPKLTYDPQKDLTPVAMLGAGAFVLVVHASVPARSVQELIALAKSRPGGLNFGSGGNGSSGQMCTELFAQGAGIKMTHVPYKGDGAAMADLLGGQIQVMFTAPNVAAPHVKAGRLRLLAVTTRARVPSMPDVPTISEAAVKDFEYLGWIALYAPSGTPKPVLEALVASWDKARRTPAVRAKLDELAMAPPEGIVSGEPLAQFMRNESTRIGRLIRELDIKAD